MMQEIRKPDDRRYTYCMNVLSEGRRCNAEIPWSRFKIHGAVCNTCESSKHIKAEPIKVNGFNQVIPRKQISCPMHVYEKQPKGQCATCDAIL